MIPCILTLNSGSSSLKFSIFSLDTENAIKRIIFGQIEKLNSTPHFAVKDHNEKILHDEIFNEIPKIEFDSPHQFALQTLSAWAKKYLQQYKITAAGHRIVHGGATFTQPIIMTDAIVKELEKLCSLAPLHQPYNLLGIKILQKINPQLFQVGVFDTSFHTTQSYVAQAFALPADISPIPIKRYGFHGISYEYIAQVLPQYMDETLANGKNIVAHLGNGASLCAMNNRKSVCTTMGFTALDGLPMGTRCGSLDPGVILYLLMTMKISCDDVMQLLYNRSGLLGVSGISADVRTLLKSDEKSAQQAIDLFVYRIQREMGSLMAALGGINNIIFTAGIGENAGIIRERVCQQFSWLGLSLDQKANDENAIKISAKNSNIGVWVIPTNEELMIAQHVYNLMPKK